MYSIPRIEELLTSANETLVKHENLARNSPSSIFYSGVIKNTRERIQELTAELVHEKKKRELEIVEIRLKGKGARAGKLSLDLFGVLSKTFADCLIEASRQAQYGNRSGSKLLSLTRQTIDLRLDGLAPGSTRVFITGKSNPDLFGNSIIEKALTNTFDLLASKDGDTLIDKSSHLGAQAIKKLNDFFGVVSKAELELDLKWEAPTQKVFVWEGVKDQILALSNSLSNLKIHDPHEIEFSGILITQSLKGFVDVIEEKKTIHTNFATTLLDKVKNIQIGSNCYGTIITTVTQNLATGEEKIHYELKDIYPS